MMSDLLVQTPTAVPPRWNRIHTLTPPYPWAARIANVAWTAQVQIAYACAVAASENAERVAVSVERAWPDTPLRSLVVQACRAQARERGNAAREVLARARRRCGLAYARLFA